MNVKIVADVKVVEVDGYIATITSNAVSIQFGGWTYTPWAIGRSDEYNAIKPSKPISIMDNEELLTLTKAGINAGLEEQTKIKRWLDNGGCIK